ncbi:MAG: hypothetical protein M3Y27_25000 [Acidobacteriota bacterium]|nr:hypothetical protein [Acidobacteriota bacterium]
MTDMEGAIKELQDAMVVIAHIEKRQSAEELAAHVEYIQRLEKRIELNLSEITYKLNGLIGFVGGQV